MTYKEILKYKNIKYVESEVGLAVNIMFGSV